MGLLHNLRFLLYRLAQQPCFVLAIRDGQIQLQHGQVGQAFVSGCQEIVDLYGLQQGLILGLKRDHYIQLRFYDLPPQLEQNFRNLWENG